MLRQIKKYKSDVVTIIVFIILPFIFFNDSYKIITLIFGNGDPNYNTLPLWDLIVTSIRNGEFPFWNRYIYSGFPLFANPQSSILYPVLWVLYFIFPLSVAYNISILLHYSLAGIFTYIFLNRYNLNKLASFCGGLVFMFSGLMICHKGHAQMLYTVVWFPLILFFLDKFRESRRFEFVLTGSIFYALAFFAGNPQMFFYGSIIILLYIIYYSFIHAKRSYYFLYSAAVFIITALLTSVQLFPIYELVNHSVRGTIDFGAFSFFSYPKKLILTLISPFIYGGGPSGVGFFGELSYIETVAYFGITTIPFLIIGFFSKNRDKYFWIFILVFSFVLVMGMNTPLYKIMYHIPLYNKFRIPTRNWFEVGLAFAILTSFGFDYFIKNFGKKIKKIIITVISLLVLIGVALSSSNLILKKISNLSFFNDFTFLKENLGSLLKTTEPRNYAIYIPLIFICILIVLLIFSIFKKNKFIYILLIFLIFFDFRSFGNYVEGSSSASYISKSIRKFEGYDFIESETQPYRVYPVVNWAPDDYTIYPNRNIHYEIDLMSGYDPLMLGDYNFFMGMFYMDDREKAEILLRNNNILSILNTKYIMYFKPDNYDDFLKNITKVFYKDNKSIVNNNSLNNAILQGIVIKDESSFVFQNNTRGLKCFKIPVKIEKNKNYLISFEIRENIPKDGKSLIDDKIFIDFFTEDYGSAEQEFLLNPEDIGTDFKVIRKVIFSEEAPADKDIYFRIFTYSNGEIEIKNIKLNEVSVSGYNNYEAVYNEDILILRNDDYLPRFYFTEKVRDVSDINEAYEILRETGAIWEESRFNPKTETLVERVDFNTVEFDTSNSEVEIQEYSNNKVKLNITAESDEFLVFSDAYYPGWNAYIDGKQVKIYRANGMVKGIFIPEGKYIIEFDYLPKNFWIYFFISMTTFVSVIVSIFIISFKRIKKQRFKLRSRSNS